MAEGKYVIYGRRDVLQLSNYFSALITKIERICDEINILKSSDILRKKHEMFRSQNFEQVTPDKVVYTQVYLLLRVTAG